MDIPFPVYLPFVIALAALVRPSTEQLRSWRRHFLVKAGRWLVRSHYRLRITGRDAIPTEGPALLICNHLSYADAPVLQAAIGRPIRFLTLDRLHRGFLGVILGWIETIPVSPRRASRAMKEAMRCLRRGEVVCIFPEGLLSFDGRISKFFPGYERLAERTGAPLVIAHLDGLWTSRLSFASKVIKETKLRRRVSVRLRRFPQPTMRTTTAPTTSESTTTTPRDVMLDMASEAFSARPALQESLGHAAVRHLCRNSGEDLAVDYAMAGKRLNRGTVLAVAATLARDLKKRCPERRIGIVLPPGLGGLMVNLGTVLAGKTPVNLNFTAGKASLDSAIEQAGIRTMITAQKVQETLAERFPDFPWVEHVLDIKEVLQGLPKWHTALVMIGSKVLPGAVMAKLLGVKRDGGDREAALLFTSGSEGRPKGAILTHRNLVGNCEQVGELGLIPKDCRLLCNLPIFHSFGFTVGLWVPILNGVRAIYTPSPLDFKMAVKAIEKEAIEVAVGTPTFFRPYLTKVKPEQLKSLRMIITGGEKTPDAFHQKWTETFPDVALKEGYGLTETSPIAALNLPDIAPTERRPEGFIGTKPGSVGRPLAGMAARVVDPDTSKPLPMGDVGILQLKGPNIFHGYLEQPEKTAEMLRDGWLHTGDLARIDEDGFIFIQGRLSRFSKLGGEMVPHGTIESALNEAYNVGADEAPRLAIASRQDEAKGEVLVLLTIDDLSVEEVRGKLTERGFSNLWIPRVIKKVPEIPVLATGKLNLKGIRELAASA